MGRYDKRLIICIVASLIFMVIFGEMLQDTLLGFRVTGVIPAATWGALGALLSGKSGNHFSAIFSRLARRAPANAMRCSATVWAISLYLSVSANGPGPSSIGAV
jgi:hypothetical protein